MSAFAKTTITLIALLIEEEFPQQLQEVDDIPMYTQVQQ